MKNVIVTGKHSYIGTSLMRWLGNYPNDYTVHSLNLKDQEWRHAPLTGYDAVVHMAGIAHVSSDPSKADLYYRVNRDLAVETAQRAKIEGVGQFVFMSSIKVYGDHQRSGVINLDTPADPVDYYGESKLQAEDALRAMESDTFRVAIVRTPMVYGKHSKGNYPRLARLAQRLPVFPEYGNRRSMIHIDNLCELLRLLIDDRQGGTYFPQNREYVNTSELVQTIARQHGHKIRLTRAFNPLIRALHEVPTVNKLFGDLAYELTMSEYAIDYRVRDFAQSIELTEDAS